MLQEAVKQIRTAFSLLILFSILTGLIYPALITGIAQLLFPWQANGSLIKQNNQVIGSLLIGQSFAEVHYFWGRPSATTPFPYNAINSSGSNFGPSNPDFLAVVKARVDDLRHIDPLHIHDVPVDLVTSSGSGLDPDISPLAAFYQVSRIAKARHISETTIQQLVYNSIKGRTFGFLGEPRVNVLQLNLALDQLTINKLTTARKNNG